MKCSQCDLIAKVKCSCNLSYLCQNHYNAHKLQARNHPFEEPKVFNRQFLSQFKSIALNKIQAIDQAKKDVMRGALILIHSIKNTQNLALQKLNKLTKDYQDLLQQNAFFESEISTINSMETMQINVQDTSIGKIEKLIEKAFSREMVSFMP